MKNKINIQQFNLNYFKSIEEQWTFPSQNNVLAFKLFNKSISELKKGELIIFQNSSSIFDDIIDINKIMNVLKYNRVYDDRIQVFVKGQKIDKLKYTHTVSRYDNNKNHKTSNQYLIDFYKLNYILKNGASLVIRSIDEIIPSLKSFTIELMKEFQNDIFIDLYSTWSKTPGSIKHWDDGDTIVVQLEGEKLWNLYGYSDLYPIRNHRYLPPSNDNIVQKVISKGDVMYLPHGYWHEVSPTENTNFENPSIHLAITMRKKNNIDYIKWIAQNQFNKLSFRRHIDITQDNKNSLIDLREELETYINWDFYKIFNIINMTSFQYNDNNNIDHKFIKINNIINVPYIDQKSKLIFILHSRIVEVSENINELKQLLNGNLVDKSLIDPSLLNEMIKNNIITFENSKYDK